MLRFRPVVVATVVTCAGLATGCQGDSGGGTAGATKEPAAAGSSPATSASPATACPTPAEIAHAVSVADKSTGVRVSGPVVCEGDWAAARLRYPGADPARVVVRRRNGTVRLVTYGTDGLCAGKDMRGAPPKIRKALDVYC